LLEANEVAVFSSNYHLYGDMSWRVMQTLRTFAPQVEVYSVDESFLDLTGIDESLLHEYAVFLKEVTEQWTGIPVSIGVAPTKVLSKVANRLAKKDKRGTRGVMVLQTPEQQKEALEKTEIRDVWGVGGASARKLEAFNINNAWQLRNMSEEWARKNLGGVVGVRLIRELRGEPCIEMKDPLETKKMIATTRMFGTPVTNLGDIKEAVATYTSRAAEKLRRQHGAARVISVFVVMKEESHSVSFNRGATRSLYATLPTATSFTHELIKPAVALVDELYEKGRIYKKAGVMLSGIVPDESIQGNLFQPETSNCGRRLMDAIDNINFSQRDDILKFASSGLTRD
ncbi:MAG TPA: SOS mutagenesis and repair protein UmuC, partial [Ferruginibacter sp.]|nr:SOS mutagenesis and repair protein UmuC [Ferruginibacter sp.]